jgi:hypothetical protein
VSVVVLNVPSRLIRGASHSQFALVGEETVLKLRTIFSETLILAAFDLVDRESGKYWFSNACRVSVFTGTGKVDLCSNEKPTNTWQ